MYNKIPGRRLKTIVYAGIWQRLDVQAEYKLPGNISEIIQKLLEEGINNESRASFNYENRYHMHCYNTKGLTYIAVVENGYSRKLAFEMLAEIRELRYPTSADLEEISKKFTANQDEDKIQRINNQVSEINDIVMQNIQKVLKNTTKLEVIAKKTDEMESRALIFKKSGDELYGFARCQNIKWTIIWGCCCLLIIGILGYVFYSALN